MSVDINQNIKRMAYLSLVWTPRKKRIRVIFIGKDVCIVKRWFKHGTMSSTALLLELSFRMEYTISIKIVDILILERAKTLVSLLVILSEIGGIIWDSIVIQIPLRS